MFNGLLQAPTSVATEDESGRCTTCGPETAQGIFVNFLQR